MVSGDWVASGGGGGGGGANQALSNLSGVAINTSLFAASGVTLTLRLNGTSSAGCNRGNHRRRHQLFGRFAGGTGCRHPRRHGGGNRQNGGSVSVFGGTPLAGVGGSIFLTANDGAGSNQGGGSLFSNRVVRPGPGIMASLSVGLRAPISWDRTRRSPAFSRAPTSTWAMLSRARSISSPEPARTAPSGLRA